MSQSNLKIWIIEDDQDTQDAFADEITEALTGSKLQVQVQFAYSDDGLIEYADHPEKKRTEVGDIEPAAAWQDSECDCIVLDMNLKDDEDSLDGGLRVLTELAKLPNACRNICISTGHGPRDEILLYDKRYWPDFEKLLDGKKLGDRIALWPKDSTKKLPSGRRVSSLGRHVVAIARAKAAGVRHNARQIAYYRSLALSDDSVLLLGESGVGKEWVARGIHESWCDEHPDPEYVRRNFFTVNCAGLTSELARAELFGVVKGAFTGAEVHTVGQVLRAAGFKSRAGSGANQKKWSAGSESYLKWLHETSPTGLESFPDTLDVGVPLPGQQPRAMGTLFLDEIHAMPLPAKRVLLRFLNGWEVAPVGYEGVIRPVVTESGRQPVPLVRIISATNDLDWIELSRGGVGRKTGSPLSETADSKTEKQHAWADVFYRLAQHVLHIAKPEVDEIEHLIEVEKHESELTDIDWDEDAVEELQRWFRVGEIKGNRREIRAIARRAMLYVRGAAFGIPVADPNRVSRRDLMRASPRQAVEVAPNLSANVVNATTSKSAEGEDPPAETCSDGRIDISCEPTFEGYLELFTKLLTELKDRKAKDNLGQWIICSEERFRNPIAGDAFTPWKLALLRTILDNGKVATLREVFVDYRKERGPDWIWARIGDLLGDEGLTAWLKTERSKRKDTRGGEILPNLKKLLSSHRDGSQPESTCDMTRAASDLAARLQL